MTEARKVRHRTGAGARLNADHIGIYRLVVTGIIIVSSAAIIASWNGLIFVAGWQHLPEEWRWVTPVMIDMAIIVFDLAMLARRSRGESLILLKLGAYGLTGVSAAANFLHTVSVRGLTTFEGWTGASLNALAPVLILLTVEVLGTLITRPKPVPRKKRRKAPARSTVTGAAPALFEAEAI